MSSAAVSAILAILYGTAAFGIASWCGLVRRGGAAAGVALVLAAHLAAGGELALLLAAAVVAATAAALVVHGGRPRPGSHLLDDVTGSLARWGPGVAVTVLAAWSPAPRFWLTAAAGALVAGAATLAIDARTPPPGAAGGPDTVRPPAGSLATAAATAVLVAALAQGLGLAGRGDAAPVALAAMGAVLSRPALAWAWRGSGPAATASTAVLAAVLTHGIVALLP